MDTRILVVVDDPTICVLIADLLTDEGYHVQTAADGQAALHHIAQSPPDLVISDVVRAVRSLRGWLGAVADPALASVLRWHCLTTARPHRVEPPP